MARLTSGLLLIFTCLLLAPLASAQTPLTLGANGGSVNVLADHIEQVGQDGLTIATGNVEITRGSSRLTADRVEINRETGDAVAQGKAIFYDGQDRLVGDRIDYNLKTGTGVVYNGSAFSSPYYRLSGERMERVGEGLYNVRRGVFTTCEGDPPLWSFRLGRATADLDDYVVGRDVSFWVQKLPLVPWVPFFAAPIRRERQSGFLLPTLGQSSEKGFFARVPFYWAISDSQDATFALDPYSKRGVGLDAEYRYILSENNRGMVQGFGIRETEKDNDDRGQFTLKHDWQISQRWSFRADVNMVSDDDFFREYGDRLHERSQQRAQSNVSASWRGESWNLVANTFWYQDLTQERPVELQRLPEIKFNGVRQPVPGTPGLLYETESSFTNFVRIVGSDGQRIDLHPRMFLPIPVAGYFTVTPFVGGRGTYYSTRVVGQRTTRDGGIPVEVTKDDPFVRGLGEWGTDLEARAARIYDTGGTAGMSALQHLIEPRVNVTWIRGANQGGTPQWDPGGGAINALSAPLADLGIDRIGRISRVTYSLTNRLNGKTVAGEGQQAVRWELMRFVLAQTYDLPPNHTSKQLGNLTGDLLIQPNQYFRLRGDAAYNVYGEGFKSFNTDLSATLWDITATTGTRFDNQAKIEFVKGELQAKLTRTLDAHGSTHWDVRSGRLLESRLGVDIHCQCAAVSLELIDRSGVGLARNEQEVRFSVNLLGLGQVGTRAGVGTLR
jgi:LPS-assembly protein